MSIGDVNSDARGSGARYNDGKPAMELIPLRVIADSYNQGKSATSAHVPYIAALYALAEWQEGGGPTKLYEAAEHLTLPQGVSMAQAWADCARVFDYGRKKYAAWNWAKGMAWSAVLGCAARHLFAMMRGEDIDPESGLPHRGHFMCNIVMLAQYDRTYPEGDDRPVEWLRAEDRPRVPAPEQVPLFGGDTDGEKWREWDGGACPVLPDSLVDYKCKGGRPGAWATDYARALNWDRIGAGSDIVAWRYARA